MKVLVINGSPRINGNTAIALNEVIKVLNEEGIETELINIGATNVRGCIACESCDKNGKCAFDDIVNVAAKKFEEADGLLIGSPVYYAAPNATMLAFMQRLFYSTKFDCRMKVGASIACARRAGTCSTVDVLNKYFTGRSMPLVSSTYWSDIFGSETGEAVQDKEGLQIMHNLGKNMAFLIKAINLGKQEYGLPELKRGSVTNYIR